MGTFRIQPHGRLQEWVAREKGYFEAEGLDYTFQTQWAAGEQPTVGPAGARDGNVQHGAFEQFSTKDQGDITCACHWATNMLASTNHGRMWGHAYSVTPYATMAPPDPAVRSASDLAGVPISVGYRSGSHFTTLQSLDKVIGAENVNMRFDGPPLERLALAIDRQVEATTVFNTQLYILEQLGFRKIVDDTFMIGFVVGPEAEEEDVWKYFRALQRAQRDIDLEPERYKHYFPRELPEKYHSLVDVQLFGPGERIVFEPYTQEMYEKTHSWMTGLDIFAAEETGACNYEAAIVH